MKCRKPMPDLPEDCVMVGFEPNWEMINLRTQPRKLTTRFRKEHEERLRVQAQKDEEHHDK
ncbi:hypothetical protein GCM10011332_21200 [Terasakiella brassicae]|uniref:Uncharacterized protein n=1 Tax=Terasakiella brassicae TaxID=1634917 RepID=A0A917C0R9_9PROT|nr:hypothetical protein [Terasakiella brassicae]GGF66851.1 hypothetical protein GCM10011332_21200 [Terasakiella brassicae]